MRRCLAFVALLSAFPVQAQMAGWTPEVKRTAVSGCRAAILQNALRDAAARNKVAPESISSEKRAEFEKAIEPWLAPCSCIIDRVSSKWAFADYTANQEKYKTEIQALLTTGGCAPKAPNPRSQ
jgi:hypothetical protein